MEEQNSARHPNVRRISYPLWLIRWCQEWLEMFTMRPVDYDEYVRLTMDHHDEEPFNVEYRRQLRVLLLQNPDYQHLRVYWNVLHKHSTGEVQLEDNPLHVFPVVLCGVLNVTSYLARFDSRRILPRRWAIALEAERVREELLEHHAVERALRFIRESVNGVGNADDAATISRALEWVHRYWHRREWARE